MNFEEYKDTLEKGLLNLMPKKEYIVGCYTPDDWKYIHEILMREMELLKTIFQIIGLSV